MKQKEFPIEFTIEEGIPVPHKSMISKWDKLPVEQMKVGQNVLLESCPSTISNARYKKVYPGVRMVLKERQKDMRFKIGMIETKGTGMVDIRLFRIK